MANGSLVERLASDLGKALIFRTSMEDLARVALNAISDELAKEFGTEFIDCSELTEWLRAQASMRENE